MIGWYVPPWMAKKYPDITDWKNLNKYADLFKTSESGGKGQLLDGDPSFVTNDAALVKNLNLNYKVVYAGSEAALITAFRKAEADKKPLLGLLLLAAVVPGRGPAGQGGPAARTRRAATPTPRRSPATTPTTTWTRSLSAKFADVRQPGRRPGQEVQLDATTTRTWSPSTSPQDKMSADDAAKKWVDANPDKVKAWLS